jgi:hypothetical protein
MSCLTNSELSVSLNIVNDIKTKPKRLMCSRIFFIVSITFLFISKTLKQNQMFDGASEFFLAKAGHFYLIQKL